MVTWVAARPFRTKALVVKGDCGTGAAIVGSAVAAFNGAPSRLSESSGVCRASASRLILMACSTTKEAAAATAGKRPVAVVPNVLIAF